MVGDKHEYSANPPEPSFKHIGILFRYRRFEFAESRSDPGDRLDRGVTEGGRLVCSNTFSESEMTNAVGILRG